MLQEKEEIEKWNLKIPPPEEISVKARKHTGFTLSEVLITLVIIGVVAAITVPNIIANSRHSAASAKIVKFYSTLSQASFKAKADGNDWNYWAESANAASDSTSDTVYEFAKQYILPYFNYYKYKLEGNSIYVYLNDGTSLRIAKGTCIDFVYDTNGDRSPNNEGSDISRFLYCPNSTDAWVSSATVIPYRPKSITSRSQALSMCKSDGKYCTALLAEDGWQFKSDYPRKI